MGGLGGEMAEMKKRKKKRENRAHNGDRKLGPKASKVARGEK